MSEQAEKNLEQKTICANAVIEKDSLGGEKRNFCGGEMALTLVGQNAGFFINPPDGSRARKLNVWWCPKCGALKAVDR